MKRTATKQVPPLRCHKGTGLAYVVLNGRRKYLGRFDKPAARERYDRLIAEWLAAGRETRHDPNAITINELIDRYTDHARAYYVKHGRPTCEPATLKQAMKVLGSLYGRTRALDFGPKALKAVREAMIGLDWSRGYVNGQISRVKLLIRWAAEQELIDASVHHGLQVVRGLAKGRKDFHGARESEPVRPVPEAHVEAIRPYVSRQVWAIAQIQLLTACRPGEAVTMRACDLETGGRVWMYRPAEHKTEHHDKARVIALGPHAQKIVGPFLKRDVSAYLFSPTEAESDRRARMHAERTTPSSCGNTPGSNVKRHPATTPGDRYDVNSYRRAIHRACKTAGIPQWSPHALRHPAATRIRREYGVEVARAVLGHSSATMTGLYAELDAAKAADVMMKIG